MKQKQKVEKVERGSMVVGSRFPTTRVKAIDAIVERKQPTLNNRNHAINIAVQEWIDRNKNGAE